MLILNKFQNTTVTEQYVIDLHEQYLGELGTRYQAQPQDHDEWTRSQFIMKLLMNYPLYVDGAMLWSAIPRAPVSEIKYAIYYENVLKPIESIYEYLSKHTINLDIVSLLHILKQFITRCLFVDCLKWLQDNTNIINEQIQFMEFIDFYKHKPQL